MQRVQRILNNANFCAHLEKIAALETERRFCRHDLQHFVDTARISYILFLEAVSTEAGTAVQEDMRPMIYAAGLLHDIGRWIEYEQGEDHALASARLAEEILSEVGFGLEEGQQICRAIQEHRGGSQVRSLLGQYLYRADKLARPCLSCDAKDACYKYEVMIKNRCLLEY